MLLRVLQSVTLPDHFADAFWAWLQGVELLSFLEERECLTQQGSHGEPELGDNTSYDGAIVHGCVSGTGGE